MTVWGVLAIICLVATIVSLIIAIVNEWDEWNCIIFVGVLISLILFAGIAIIQSVKLNKEQIRQTKEREQILYQVEHLSEGKDKIKLNEWILTYNDWVNDVNTEKETFGWFAWHSNFDMSKHQIIDLV